MSGAALLKSITSNNNPESNITQATLQKETFKTTPTYGVISEPNDPDFDALFSQKEELQNATLLHNKYSFYCLKRTKNSVNENYSFE